MSASRAGRVVLERRLTRPRATAASLSQYWVDCGERCTSHVTCNGFQQSAGRFSRATVDWPGGSWVCTSAAPPIFKRMLASGGDVLSEESKYERRTLKA
eukprot:1876817-Rhodomonas_salina.4